MTPEEQVAGTLVSLAERDQLHEWPEWRLRETMAMLQGAKIALTLTQYYDDTGEKMRRMHPMAETFELLDQEISKRRWR